MSFVWEKSLFADNFSISSIFSCLAADYLHVTIVEYEKTRDSLTPHETIFQEKKTGVVIYDDLNVAHVVETDHEVTMDQFSTENTLYHNTTLTTFQM